MREITKRTALRVFSPQFRRSLCSAPLAVTRAAPADRQLQQPRQRRHRPKRLRRRPHPPRATAARVHRLRCNEWCKWHAIHGGGTHSCPKYSSRLPDAAKKDLGAPYDNEKKTLDGSGVYQQFDGGVLILPDRESGLLRLGQDPRRLERQPGFARQAGLPDCRRATRPDGSFKSTFEPRHHHVEAGRRGGHYHYELSARGPLSRRVQCRIGRAVVAWRGDIT